MRYPEPAMQALDPESIAHAAELISQSDALTVAAVANRVRRFPVPARQRA